MKTFGKVMTTIGIVGACAGIGTGTYMYMKKRQELIKKYMAYLQK